MTKQKQQSEVQPTNEERNPCESDLWELQRRAYLAAGPTAWSREKPIPFYVSCTPFLAHAYAAMIGGFLEDLAASHAPAGAEPLTIVELGAGSGKLACYLLRELDQHPDVARLSPNWHYILTDIADATIEWWRSHERLRPFVEAGRADFARFDCLRDQRVDGRLSQRTVAVDQGSSPLVVIANYVFDSVAVDVFRTAVKRLEMGRPVLQPQPGATAAAGLAQSALSFDFAHISPKDAYPGDETWAAILEEYRQELEGSFTLPNGLIQTVNRFVKVGNRPALFLIGDKGPGLKEEVTAIEVPIARHDDVVSFTVNFHAAAEYIRRQGGLALTPSAPRQSFLVAAFAFARESQQHFAELCRTYDAAIDAFGPVDVLPLLARPITANDHEPVESFLSLLRLTRDDPEVVLRHGETIAGLAARSDASIRRRLGAALVRVHANFFPVGSADARLLRTLARLEFALEHFRRAAELLTCALSMHDAPHQAATLFNLALCHRALGEWREAERCLIESLRLSPADANAQRVLAEVRGHCQ